MLWPDLQIFLVETIPHILFSINKRSRQMPIIEQFFIKLTKAVTGGVP